MLYTQHMVNLKEIIKKKSPKVGNTLFIAVDGHGGSGKSIFAKFLAERLNAEIIHTDDFAGWKNPLNWWPDVIKKVFEPIINGATALSYQPASWWENHHPAVVENQPVTPIIILEGVSSARKEFDDFISLRIFVDTPDDICLQRGVERDKSTGKSVEELTQLWKDWIKKENKYFAKDDPKAKADIIFDGTLSFDTQLNFNLWKQQH